MVKDDKYSDKEFDSEHEMHLYWAKNHMDDLNSHDKDKAKKALSKKENEKAAQREWRKKMFFRGTAGLVAVVLVYLAAPSIAGMFTGGGSIDYSDLNLEEQPRLGDADANITVVEFGDYRCGACQSFNQEVKPELQDKIDSGEVKFYFMDFNVLGPQSRAASEAAECVYQQDQEQFWSFHDALFDNRGSFSYGTEGLTSLAEENTEGLDYDELQACIDNQNGSEAVSFDNEAGRSNGVSATPTVFVNEDRVSNWNNLASIIEDNYQ